MVSPLLTSWNQSQGLPVCIRYQFNSCFAVQVTLIDCYNYYKYYSEFLSQEPVWWKCIKHNSLSNQDFENNAYLYFINKCIQPLLDSKNIHVHFLLMLLNTSQKAVIQEDWYMVAWPFSCHMLKPGFAAKTASY